MTPTPAPSDPALRRPAGGGVRFGEFAVYRGWLSPGVRLFTRMDFRQRALAVALAFLVPLALLLAFVWRDAREQVASTRQELQGVVYVRALHDLMAAAQARRRAATLKAADLSDRQAQVAQAFDALRSTHQAIGREVGADRAFAALETLHTELLARPLGASPDETFARHVNYLNAILALVRDVADGSQLVLDPDLDTFHMMEIAVLRGPIQWENTAKLRGIGSLALSEGALSANRREPLLQWRAVAGFVDADVETAYQRGIAVNPELSSHFDMKGVDQAYTAFLDAVDHQLLGEKLDGKVDTFLALGNAAVDQQRKLFSQVLDRLEAGLKARNLGLEGSLARHVGLSVLFIALAAYLMLSFHAVTTGGLQEVSGHLDAISCGNLATTPAPWGPDEAARMMLSIAAMHANLRRVISTVRQSSTEVQGSSAEIADATHDLSQRTERAAASLEETASSTEQIASTVKQTADTVEGAMAIVQGNASAATEGGRVIEEVIRTMQGIRDSSSRIGEIIGVIDSIAFQTNILALNAAVEAARAGEQGRGFAVVASEVRALAGRSSEAAREIKGLIGESLSQVEAGGHIVEDAGTRMRDIVDNAERIAGLMNQIAQATREQSAGVGLVGSAVHELDESTQQNAALVEQTAAATTSLKQQAERLAAEVAFFQLQRAEA